MTRARKTSTTELTQRGRERRCPPSYTKRAQRKLDDISAVEHYSELRMPPGNRLHALKGDRAGQHAIHINDQYRICFSWDGTDATGVEITDYH